MEKSRQRWRLIYTVIMFLSYITYVNMNMLYNYYSSFLVGFSFHVGICVSILGPGLVDFGYIYGSSLEKVSYSVSLVSGGYLIGSFTGLTYRWLNRQLLMVFFVTLQALTTAAMPYYPSLVMFFIANTLNGIGSGAWDSSISVWLVEMWPGKHSAPVLQGVQFMYGVGATVAPIIAAPFVHGDNNATLNYTFTGPERQQYLTLPFGMAGLAHTALAAMLGVLYLIKPYCKSDYVNDEKQGDNKQIEEVNKVPYRFWIGTLLGLSLAFYGATETTYTNFATALWINPNTTGNIFSATESANLLSIMYGVYTMGRLASSFITLKIKPGYVLVYHYLIMFGSFSLLYFGRNSHTLVYVGVVCLGYGFSASWSAILGFTETHVKLTQRVGSIFSLLAGLAQLTTPLVLASLLETHPLMLFAIVMVTLSITSTCFILATILIRFGRYRHSNQQKSSL